MEATATQPQPQVKEADKTATKKLWRVFWILLIVTLFEVAWAYVNISTIPKVSLFVILTLVKAFYIVGEFMHLKHEVKQMGWTIILPMLFVAWLLVVLLVEGGSIFKVVFGG
ncbi:MAG: cytochrome C oxidase subunit IV family protein [Bacteroidetes bacterium]|nr:cytochrome C oxidase subunit IV family protein [Bacteroidota bacterium]